MKEALCSHCPFGKGEDTTKQKIIHEKHLKCAKKKSPLWENES
jgi:hypothetical protein